MITDHLMHGWGLPSAPGAPLRPRRDSATARAAQLRTERSETGEFRKTIVLPATSSPEISVAIRPDLSLGAGTTQHSALTPRSYPETGQTKISLASCGTLPSLPPSRRHALVTGGAPSMWDLAELASQRAAWVLQHLLIWRSDGEKDY